MIGAALVLVLPPLLRSDPHRGAERLQIDAELYRQRLAELEADRADGILSESASAQARREMEDEALETLARTPRPTDGAAAPLSAIVVALAVPTLAFGLYLQLGTPVALKPQPRQAAPLQEQLPHSLEEMVARLETRLKGNPEDAEGWAMLGRSYAVMDQLEAARGAFEEAMRRKGDDVDVVADYAEVLAGLNNGDLRGRPAHLLETALARAPENPKVLWLASMAAYQDDNLVQALDRLRRLRGTGELDPELSKAVNDLIADAESRLGAATPSDVVAGTAPAARIEVQVLLDASLAAQAEPTDTVFILARPSEGSRMPLSIVRRQVQELPVTVILDDSQSMSPSMRLSQFRQVVVAARVSKSGSALPVTGDLEGVSEPIAVGQTSRVVITVNRVLP